MNTSLLVTELPLDRRSRVKDAGDTLLAQVVSFKALDGVEDEFLYDIPQELKAKAETFEHEIKRWHIQRPLTAPEMSVACGVFRRARGAAEQRRFMELADWLGSKESVWKTKLYWTKRSYGTALLLSFVGITTGHGTSISRWLLSIGAIIVCFAYIASGHLEYGTKRPTFGNALYWSLITISTLGYGDITPKDQFGPELVAAVEAVIGLVMFIVLGMLIGDRVRRQ